LLAVDDSKTLRKVLEITFAGEDYKMVLANSPADAMAKLKAERPVIALVDALLGAGSGYDLCQQIKAEAPQVGVIVLSSKQHPYDRVKGGSVGADDFIDKPYDSQALIDKVAALSHKLAAAPAPAARPAAAPIAVGSAKPAIPAAAASSATAVRTTMSFGAPQAAASSTPVKPAPVAIPSGQPSAFGARHEQPASALGARPAPVQPIAAARPVAPGPTPVAVTPFAARAVAPAPAAAAPVAAAAAPVAAVAPAAALIDASMETKLTALGLTKDQISGVLALSREVLEQVVWEVVPVLAETMIREEIKRVTAE
jgi:CheY-like chemotaxis protein